MLRCARSHTCGGVLVVVSAMPSSAFAGFFQFACVAAAAFLVLQVVLLVNFVYMVIGVRVKYSGQGLGVKGWFEGWEMQFVTQPFASQKVLSHCHAPRSAEGHRHSVGERCEFLPRRWASEQQGSAAVPEDGATCARRADELLKKDMPPRDALRVMHAAEWCRSIATIRDVCSEARSPRVHGCTCAGLFNPSCYHDPNNQPLSTPALAPRARSSGVQERCPARLPLGSHLHRYVTCLHGRNV